VNNSSISMPQSGELSLRDVVRVMYAGRGWLISLTIVSTLACSAWALLSTSIYRSSAVLAPVNPDRSVEGLSSALGQIGGLAAVAGINVEPRDARTEEALAVLKSRQFIEQVISDHKLLPKLFPRKWDSRTQNWNVSASQIPTPWKAYKYFTERVLNIDRDKKTGLVTVNIDWKNRAEGAEWANEIVERVNDEMRVRALNAAVLSTQYLEREREAAPFVETRNAINNLIEAEIKQKMLASVTKEYAFRVVDRALPADADDILRPKRVLLVLSGLFGGALVGSLAVLVRFGYRRLSIRNGEGSAHVSE
jgi:uncharacterized protein involved in exopolysaccharide biosynthesis